MLISVSDHETGGLSLGKQLDPATYPALVRSLILMRIKKPTNLSRYLWYPDAIVNATSSTYALARRMTALAPISENDVVTQLASGLGITDATESEIRAVQGQDSNVWALDKVLSSLVGRMSRSPVKWMLTRRRADL